MSQLLLTPAEARVIAALVEKSISTPQYYPMSVNAIMLAANQKSCRNPVTGLSEGDVGAALNRMEQDKLCSRDPFSGRVTKWRHQFQHQTLLQPPAVAVLVMLMLRGPQTASELRSNAVGIGGPAEAETVLTVLNDLGERVEPMVVLLPRASGQKEARYAHLLCGPVSATASEAAVPASTTPPTRMTTSDLLAQLQARVEALEARMEEIDQHLSTAAQGGSAS